jgi:hypothetical protein
MQDPWAASSAISKFIRDRSRKIQPSLEVEMIPFNAQNTQLKIIELKARGIIIIL